MSLRSRVKEAVSGPIEQGKTVIESQLARAQTNAAISPTINLLEDDAEWDEVGDLTDDFDRKLATFMDFDDVTSARRWILDA